MSKTPLLRQQQRVIYDDDYLDDMLGVFADASGYAPRAGGVGKYIYGAEKWGDVVEHSQDYYVPEADSALIKQAITDIKSCGIPQGVTYIDYGVGGAASFTQNALPIIQQLGCKSYIGVDFCPQYLGEIQSLDPDKTGGATISTKILDLFFPTNQVLAKSQPALGVMNGLTLTNIYNGNKYADHKTSLVEELKYLSQLSGRGWLLLTIDTNQNQEILKKAYASQKVKHVILSIFRRMVDELPTENFDPTLFEYAPEFDETAQALRHIGCAKEEQHFKLGPYSVHIAKDQKIHLCNSYKWRAAFFEECCAAANLTVVKDWSHETGMMLYLLKDNTNPLA